jgi:hypothetical protein
MSYPKIELKGKVIDNKYSMYIEPILLTKLKLAGIDINEAILFFGTQIDAMITCPPNYGPHKNGLNKLPIEVRLLKGYYPKTSQLFKISVIDRNGFFDNYKYTVKVSEPTPKYKRNDYHKFVFSSSQIESELSKRLENNLLNTDQPISDLISLKDVKKPKCISPKGMKLFKLEED